MNDERLAEMNLVFGKTKGEGYTYIYIMKPGQNWTYIYTINKVATRLLKF